MSDTKECRCHRRLEGAPTEPGNYQVCLSSGAAIAIVWKAIGGTVYFEAYNHHERIQMMGVRDRALKHCTWYGPLCPPGEHGDASPKNDRGEGRQPCGAWKRNGIQWLLCLPDCCVPSAYVASITDYTAWHLYGSEPHGASGLKEAQLAAEDALLEHARKINETIKGGE